MKYIKKINKQKEKELVRGCTNIEFSISLCCTLFTSQDTDLYRNTCPFERVWKELGLFDYIANDVEELLFNHVIIIPKS